MEKSCEKAQSKRRYVTNYIGKRKKFETPIYSCLT